MKDKIAKQGQSQLQEWSLDGAFKWADSSGVEHHLTRCQESDHIEGNPPELLVFRSDSHQVDAARDQWLDCAPLFRKKLATDAANYELVGFAQNHGQVHWTSVVYSNGQWQYCDDSIVRPVEPVEAIFRVPANYLVYKLRRPAPQSTSSA